MKALGAFYIKWRIQNTWEREENAEESLIY